MLADILIPLAELQMEEDQPFSPRPSLAGPDRCLRKLYYHAIEAPKKSLPGRFFLTMDDSSWHEELTADWIRKSSYKLHSVQMHVDIPMPGMEWMPPRVCQVPLGGKPCGHSVPRGNIGAHLDGLLQEPMLDEWHYEHKALNHFTYKSMWEEANYPVDYFVQCALYDRGLVKIMPDLLGTVLLIKNKNTAQYMEFLMRYDFDNDRLTVFRKTTSSGDTQDINYVMENVATGASQRFNIVHDAFLASVAPPRKYEIGDWQCDYCLWNGVCWGDYEREFLELRVGTTLPDDIANTLNYLAEMRAERRRIETEESRVKKELIEIMKTAYTREARAGEYILKRKLQKRVTPDVEKIPKAILKDCMKESIYEQLTFTKPKGKPNGEGNQEH